MIVTTFQVVDLFFALEIPEDTNNSTSASDDS